MGDAINHGFLNFLTRRLFGLGVHVSDTYLISTLQK
jgi:hypothetical protein